METISRMSLTAGCLQYVSSAALKPLLESFWNRLFLLCFPFNRLSSIAVWCLHRGYWPGKKEKLTEDLFSIQHMPIVISKMDTLHLLKHICCGNHLIIRLVHRLFHFHFSCLPEIMTEFINIVSWVEWKDICGIDFQVLSPSPVKYRNKSYSYLFQKFPSYFWPFFSSHCHTSYFLIGFTKRFLHF